LDYLCDLKFCAIVGKNPELKRKANAGTKVNNCIWCKRAKYNCRV